MRRAKIIILTVLMAAGVGLVFAQKTHPLAKASRGDWAKYLVTVDNSTQTFLSSKDKPRWRAVTDAQETGVRIDSYMLFGDRRAPAGPVWIAFNETFEPVFEISTGAKIEVVSSTPESVTVNGKTYACTKSVRKVSRPLKADVGQISWNGTSTIWTCPDIPVGGIVKIENDYESQMSGDTKPDRIKEIWTLAEFGLKNWKE